MLVKKMLELLMNYSDTEKFVMEVKLHYRDGNPISYFDVYSKEKTIVLRDDSNRPMEKRQPDISLAVNSINYMTMQKEYELNRKWIVDDVGETIGETNFVIAEEFLLAHWKECPNYDEEENIEDFLETYVPEEDGQYLYELAKDTGNLIEDIGQVLY